MNIQPAARPASQLLLTRLILLLLIIGVRAHAAQVTATWTGAGGNANWNNAANWSTPNFPDNGTPSSTTYNVVIDGNSGATANVSLNVIVAIDALTVNSGDSLAVVDNQAITVVNSGAGTGTIANAGTIALNSQGNVTRLIINGEVTLSGGGTITLLNNPNNHIFGAVATNGLIDGLTNVNNTIQGAGQIGGNTMALTNGDDFGSGARRYSRFRTNAHQRGQRFLQPDLRRARTNAKQRRDLAR